MPRYRGNQAISKRYFIQGDGTEREIKARYKGRRKVFSAPELPHISAVSLQLRDSSQAVVAPDATGTGSDNVTVQSYRESTFGRAHDLRITATYERASSVACTRITPGTDDANIPSISTGTTQAVFGALTEFLPETHNEFRATATNIEGSDHHSIDLQYWSQPTIQISLRSDTTVSGSPPITVTELYITVTRTGEPTPSLTIASSDGSRVPDISRAFRYGFGNSREMRLTRAVTNSPVSVTYTVTASNNVPGGAAPLTASASTTFSWP